MQSLFDMGLEDGREIILTPPYDLVILFNQTYYIVFEILKKVQIGTSDVVLGPHSPSGFPGACFDICHQLFSTLCTSVAAMNEIVLVFFSDVNSVSRKLARRRWRLATHQSGLMASEVP